MVVNFCYTLESGGCLSTSQVQSQEASVTENVPDSNGWRVSLCQGLGLTYPLPMTGKKACERELSRAGQEDFVATLRK